MKEKWIKRPDSGKALSREKLSELSRRLNVPETAVELAWLRGITDLDAFFSKGDISDGSDMLDMDKTVHLLKDALDKNQGIRIIGDYDMDGCMSTHILRQGLTDAAKKIGSTSRISWDIPDRLKDGYGLNIRLVEKAQKDAVQLLLTCDNGIAAAEAVSRAKELGLTIIVTDHHQVPRGDDNVELLPPADAVVDPHRDRDPSSLKDICGAVVAYKVIRCLHTLLELSSDAAAGLLPYAAFASVTDVMPLIGENREIVRRGLPHLKENLGMRFLCEENGISGTVSAADVGYFLGPCGNAAGRIGNIQDVLTLLQETVPEKAQVEAKKLIELNEKRKRMCTTAEEVTRVTVEALVAKGDRVLVLYVPHIHEGIIGIVAGRIREIYNRPTILFTGDSVIKGSGRSTETWNMFEHLSHVGKAYPNLLKKFGGHASAAGLTLYDIAGVKRLREALNQDSGISDDDLLKKIIYDKELSIRDITIPMIQALQYLEPCGNGNEAPRFFLRDVRGSLRLLGKDYNTVRVNTETAVSILSFRTGEQACQKAAKRYRLSADEIRYAIGTPVLVSAIGSLGINEYRGERTPQFIAESYVFI